ncbi:hypothetical protein GCM10027098_06990 [Bowmanella dokdonensis]
MITGQVGGEQIALGATDFTQIPAFLRRLPAGQKDSRRIASQGFGGTAAQQQQDNRDKDVSHRYTSFKQNN